MSNQSLDRRGFIKLMAVGAGTLAGMQVLQGLQVLELPTAFASETGSSPHKWVMVIDQAKCTGCGYCTNACRAHNDVTEDIAWNRVISAGENRRSRQYSSRDPACTASTRPAWKCAR